MFLKKMYKSVSGHWRKPCGARTTIASCDMSKKKTETENTTPFACGLLSLSKLQKVTYSYRSTGCSSILKTSSKIVQPVTGKKPLPNENDGTCRSSGKAYCCRLIFGSRHSIDFIQTLARSGCHPRVVHSRGGKCISMGK